jgi:hypothetical protein
MGEYCIFHILIYSNLPRTVRYALELERLQDLFQLPLSKEVYQEYCELDILLNSVQYTDDNDNWSYI